MGYIIGIKIFLILMLIPVSSYSAFYEKCYGYTSYKNRYYPCYSHGNCTWWAAYKRPDLKAFSLGDAGSWYNNSLPHGYHVGNKPAVGAVVVFNNDGYGHVAYVENVYGDGSFQVTEMDYFGSFGDGMSLARYYRENGHYRRLPNGGKYPEGLQGTKWNVTGFIYYRDCMFITEDIGVVCWDHEDGDFYWPEDAFYFSLYKYDKKEKTYTEEFLEGGEGRSYFDKIAENPSDYPDAKLIDLGVYLAKGKAEDGNVLGIGGIGGPGYPTFPIDPAASGKLPDFIIDKVIMANKSGSKEKYTWKINETAYVHAWVDNIGDADWEGDAEKIKVPFYLSKGRKEDRHSKWVRAGREKIKKNNLKIKKKPKHEKIKFDLLKWANEGKVLPGRTYNFVVCADRPKDENNKDGDVKEKHKSNNCSTEAVFYVDFGPARDVDLITRNLALTHGLTELQAGQKYGLQVEISNIGTEQPWNGFRTSYQIKGPGTGGKWQTVADDGSDANELYGGATQFEYISDGGMVKAPMVGGDYTFRACADYQQVVPETDEGNNCTELEVYIVPPPMPDLITHSLRLTHGRTELYVGDLYGLEVGIKNIGEVTPDNDFRSSYEIKGPGTGDAWQFVADDGSHAEEVPPGATQWEYITDGHGAHIPNTPGIYTARACADYQGDVAEEDEGNNCSEMTFEVKPEPTCVILNPMSSLPTTGSFDLEATSIEFPDTINQGDSMHPSADLCGVSGSSPETRAIWAYANCDGTGFTAFDDDGDDGKDPGECITEENIKGDDVANMSPGRYVMYFLANGKTKMPESDYSNNVAAKVFVVE